MDELWEKAVEMALDGQTDVGSVRTLTLDSAVKCVHGRLPPPSIFEKFVNLQHLSMANIGVSSLEQFPRLRNLQKLILSDNRIAGGLEFLVGAGLESLRDLDLSNNRISDVNDLRPLAELRLVSLDLYECPVTRVKDYRSLVFGLIRSLRFLDKMDVDGNERPESDDEDEEDEEEEEEEDDPGSGEIDGDDHQFRLLSNGHGGRSEGVVDADDEEESDADEEETETVRAVNGGANSHVHSNGFIRAESVNGEDGEDGEDEGEETDDSVDEVYEEEDDDDEEDDDVVEVHEIDSDDDEEDGVEDDDEDEDEEEVDNDERDLGDPGSTGRLTSTEGEIDAHEQGEEDADEDDDGETGEEEQAVGDEGDFDDEEDEVTISLAQN